MDSLGSDRGDRNPPGTVATGVQTLDRAVALLEVVADAGPTSLAALAEATGLTRPTAHRLARAFEDHGLLGRDDRGRLRLGGRLVGWGALAGRSLGLAQVAGPVLDQLLARPARARSSTSAKAIAGSASRRPSARAGCATRFRSARRCR